MIKYEDFKKAFLDLEYAFNKKLEEAQEHFYYKQFKEWSPEKLKYVVEYIVKSNDKFPTIAQMIKAAETFTGVSNALKRVIDCYFCEGTGMVHAVSKDGYKTAFRCNKCMSLVGGSWERMAVWGESAYNKGYRLDEMTGLPLDEKRASDQRGLSS